jgi:hypothetical protein
MIKETISVEYVPEKIIREVMDNYPEASSASLRCTNWNYNDLKFEFLDCEEDKKYKVDRVNLQAGLKTLLKELAKGNLPGLSIHLGNFKDAGSWDADAADALVQCAIFGGVIYG